ncbi:hypothetical protein [Nocardia abscessus]|uniref:hypothetical protein n=1 Tax=Nocardia abscessus TaxID=120957 RepID=UPI002457A1EF|nr:hypothetical protein [Nocardia abscessus]
MLQEQGWAAMTGETWFVRGSDVHLRIWLGGMVFDYAATAVAARNMVRDWRRKPWFTIELIRDTIEERRLLPRLPYERLFAGP